MVASIAVASDASLIHLEQWRMLASRLKPARSDSVIPEGVRNLTISTRASPECIP